MTLGLHFQTPPRSGATFRGFSDDDEPVPNPPAVSAGDRPVSVADRFAAASSASGANPGDIELLPVRLAKACVQVLPVAGAGLSALAHPDLRLPIGASDEVASYVERLQFTYGEGPCLRAYHTGRPQFLTADELLHTWPELYRDLTTLTPFRAVTSLPLLDNATRIGALDLYLPEPAGLNPGQLADAFTVAGLISAALAAARVYTAEAQLADPFDPPHGTHQQPMAGRVQVWKAMGLLNVHLQLTAPDALALLRAHAYATERLIDDLAHDIVTKRFPVEKLRP